jgi:hypothetical protein
MQAAFVSKSPLEEITNTVHISIKKPTKDRSSIKNNAFICQTREQKHFAFPIINLQSGNTRHTNPFSTYQQMKEMVSRYAAHK